MLPVSAPFSIQRASAFSDHLTAAPFPTGRHYLPGPRPLTQDYPHRHGVVLGGAGKPTSHKSAHSPLTLAFLAPPHPDAASGFPPVSRSPRKHGAFPPETGSH